MVTKPFIHVASNRNMCGYQLRTGWGGFIGVLLMLPEASAHVFLCRAWEEGAGWPGSSV